MYILPTRAFILYACLVILYVSVYIHPCVRTCVNVCGQVPLDLAQIKSGTKGPMGILRKAFANKSLALSKLRISHVVYKFKPTLYIQTGHLETHTQSSPT